MPFILTITLLAVNGIVCIHSSEKVGMKQNYNNDCGIQPAGRQPRAENGLSSLFYNDRIPKIIAGSPTKEGQFPWQASLELLHPSMGFLGHWCGGVLIDKFWILSAAHCVHNDLFNLPIPPLWTVVLGEHDRSIESGYEQRIPVEKIVLHKSYHNFLHDLVLMKLSVPADLTKKSNIRRVCLPLIFDDHIQPLAQEQLYDNNFEDNWEELESSYNYLRSAQNKKRLNITIPSMKELLTTKIISRLYVSRESKHHGTDTTLYGGRRNDKFMRGLSEDGTTEIKPVDDIKPKHPEVQNEYTDLPYIDCVATGWGKSNNSGDLTDILLKTSVPLHNNARCRDAYGSFVRVHRGHLCAGKLNGKGGTCVGDSGGPLQCRLTKHGPWILAGITSFGSGCAVEGFPDVYTRTSFYMKWIQDIITSE